MGTALKRLAAKTLRLKINLGGNTTAREVTAKSHTTKKFRRKSWRRQAYVKNLWVERPTAKVIHK